MDDRQVSLYSSILGARYRELPAITRNIHDIRESHIARGTGRVERGSNPATRWLANLLGLPKSGENIPVTTRFRRLDNREEIERNFDGTILTTCQTGAAGKYEGMLQENFGPFRLYIKLDGHRAGIDFILHSVLLGPVTLPERISPRLDAHERARGGKHCYFVRISLPLIGKLIEYEGELDLVRQPHHEKDLERIDVV